MSFTIDQWNHGYKKNNREMHSTQWRKSVVAERFIRTLKNKIYKHMIAKSRNVYIDKLVKIFNKCNNTYHRISKMKPVEVKLNT